MARILVIDDDVEICTLTKRFLLLDGHEVDTAEDGAVGLKLAGRNQYDLVITDVIMPEQDGIEVVVELKKLYPHIRIIVMTCLLYTSDAADDLLCVDLGGRRIIKKNISICLLYTSPSPRDGLLSRMPSSA